MLRRTLTALAMAPILVGAIIFPEPRVFQTLAWLCIGLALYEYFHAMWPGLKKADQLFAVISGILLTAWFIFCDREPLSLLLAPAVTILLACLYFLIRGRVEDAHHYLGHYVFGIFYVAGLGAHIAWLRGLPDGVFWVFTALLLTWGNDTVAYFSGRFLGRHALASRISPGKTWEGWCGGVLGSALAMALVCWIFPQDLTWAHKILLVGIASIFGPAGDLAESLLKRSVKVKDSGRLIPGHGGVLDRIDALLFTGPLIYYIAIYIG